MSQSHQDRLLLKRLGETIKRLRIARDVTQEELADLASVHRTYIGMVERGEKNITYLSAQKIATALGISLSELFEEIDDGQ